MKSNIAIALIKCSLVLTFLFDSTIVKSQCNHPDDIAGLTAIYTAMGGSTWSFNTNSDTSDDWIPNCNGCDLSQWNGITCENGRVSSINLGNPVTPQNIGVNGDFPNISVSMTGVKLINLANEEVSALPMNIGTMFPNLEYLDLIFNDLSGTIPNSISSLSKLTFLDLGNNQLTGNMPDFSGCNLNVISLANNLLKGSITLNFLNSTVNYFGMQQNPTANFNNNNFSGFLPDEYGIIDPAINVDIVLVFEGNQIDGPIPSSYSQDDRLRISIRFNEMTGCFPDALRSHPDLPINSTNSPTVFTPNIEEGNCFDASWFEFINNNLAACNSNYVCSDPGYESWNAESLIAFYNATNGSQWTNNEGWAEGAAGESCNPCCWFGITCEFPSFFEYTYGTIVGIELPNNNIDGPLTTDLSNIETLKKLNLFGNKLSGKFPGEYGDLQNLTLINVASNNLIGCYDPNLSNLCPISSNSTISDNNNFDEQWSSFCFNGKGECDDSDPCVDNTVISFDGTDDWIQASSPLNGDTDYTISIDFKGGVQLNGTYPRLLGFTSFETEIAVKGQELAYFNGNSWTDSGINVADNMWHNVTLVKENAENRLYLDGLLLSSLAAPANLNFIGSVSIGSTSNGSGEFFNGLIDNVNIWDAALSNEQVCDNINSGGSPNVLNFDFEEGQGNANNTTISGPTDLAGGNNNGTFSGMSLTGGNSNYICEDYSLSCDIDPCDNDTTPPMVGCPVNVPTVSVNSTETFTPSSSIFNIVATDDCRIRTDFSPNVLTCDDLGDNVVIATVTDEAGNASSCTILFVLDDPSNYCEKSCVNNTVMHFDGVNDKVVANSPLTGNSDYTISVDFKCGPQSNGAYPRLVAFTSFETEIAVKDTELAYYNGSSWIDSGINVADNVCHNVTLTRSNNQNTLYLDGGIVSVIPGPSTLAFGGQVNIGGQDTGTIEFFGGTIDNVRIWRTALDSSDVCVLNTLVPNALHYDFEEGNGDNNNTGIAGPTDLILNGINGSFSGFSLDGTSSNYICDDVCDAIKPCFDVPMECNQMCMTDVVDLSTGVDFNDGSLLPIGQYDGGWVMVSGPDTDLNYPQPGFVLTPNSAWSGQLDAQYISPFANTSNNNSFPIAYAFERQFCICEETKVTLEVSALFDNFIDIGLYDDSGNLIEQLINVQSNSANNFQVPSTSSTCHDLTPGVYSLRAGLRNDAQVSMGMAIEASLSGAGLIESGCCSPYQYLTGTVFEDTGCDGVYNTNSDPAFSDIMVSLCDQSGMVVQQSTTDDFGFYTFFDVNPGQYTVKQETISGLELILGDGGYSIDVMPNTVTANLDFGNCKDPCGNDTTPPMVACPVNVGAVIINSNQTLGIGSSTFNISATDDCRVRYDFSPNVLTCDDLGDNVVIATVTDEAGNSSSCNIPFVLSDPNNYCDIDTTDCDPYLVCELENIVSDSCQFLVQDYSTSIQVLDSCCTSASLVSAPAGLNNHSLIIMENGALWGWGFNSSGQLGIGNTQSIGAPMLINCDKWHSVSVGGSHSLAIKENGTLWASGSNLNGILGVPGISSSNVFVQVGTDSDWDFVHCTSVASFGIKNDGSLWAWGRNFQSALGLGDDINRDTPTRVGNSNDWLKVESDGANVGALGMKTDGTVWGWGFNNVDLLIPIALGDIASTPLQLLPESGFKDLSVQGGSAYVIDSSNKLWGWGVNLNGQMGIGTTSLREPFHQIETADNWQNVEAGSKYMSVLNSSGEVYSVGRGVVGSIGNGMLNNQFNLTQSLVSNVVDISTVSEGTFCLRQDGTLMAFGGNGFGVSLGIDMPQGTYPNPITVSFSQLPINVSDNYTFIQEPALGELITENTKVTLTAYDENDIALDSCCLSITLCDSTSCDNDVIAPNCITQDVSLSLDASGNATVIVDQIDAGSNDDCGIETLFLEGQLDYTCSNIGANEVTLVVIDNSGNSSNCIAAVTLVDDIAPICNAGDITVELSSNGEVTITPSDIDTGSSDNCDIELSLDRSNFTCDDRGNLIVTLTISDMTNVTTCTAVVTVLAADDICNDPTCIFTCTDACSTDVVNLSTGISSIDESFLSIGDYDANWTLISSPDPGIQVPRPAFVLNPNPVWDNLSGSQYISAYPDAVNNANNISDGTYYEFEKCFCVCDDINEVRISLAAYVDNNLEILLFDSNGNQVQSLLNITDITSGAFTGDPEETETTLNLENGVYCMRARLKNDGGQTMGMSIEARILGIGLIENQCCKTYNSITGIVFDDIACDGLNSVGSDAGISGWDIQLCSFTGTIVETITSDAFGYYSFNNIPPGEYIAKALNPNADMNSTDTEVQVTIGLNEVFPVDFGFCDVVTSTSKTKPFDNLVTVYPIPFSESLVIDFAKDHSGYDCKILNSVGQVMNSFIIEKSIKNHIVLTDDIPSGIYYIFLSDKIYKTQKVIKVLRY